jgi:hypothetical protein
VVRVIRLLLRVRRSPLLVSWLLITFGSGVGLGSQAAGTRETSLSETLAALTELWAVALNYAGGEAGQSGALAFALGGVLEAIEAAVVGIAGAGVIVGYRHLSWLPPNVAAVGSAIVALGLLGSHVLGSLGVFR